MGSTLQFQKWLNVWAIIVTRNSRCSRERSADAIALLPEAEREEILAEQGDITMTCELCGTTYRFGREVLTPQSAARTLH